MGTCCNRPNTIENEECTYTEYVTAYVKRKDEYKFVKKPVTVKVPVLRKISDSSMSMRRQRFSGKEQDLLSETSDNGENMLSPSELKPPKASKFKKYSF